MDQVSLRQHALDSFAESMKQFLDAIAGVFPECVETRKYCYKFDIGITHATGAMANANKETLISKWHAVMEPMYERCKARDTSVIQELCAIPDTFASNMALWSKWTDTGIQKDTHDVIWAYIDNLNKFCQMHTLYKNVPDKMMTSIQSMATTMAEGGAAPTDMLQMGKTLASTVDPSEMRAFATSMLSNMKSLTNLCASILPGTGFAQDLAAHASQSLENEEEEETHE